MLLDASDPLLKIKKMLISKETAAEQWLSQEALTLRLSASGALASNAVRRCLQVAFMDKQRLSDALRDSGAIATDRLYAWSEENAKNAEVALRRAIAGAISLRQAHLKALTDQGNSAVVRAYVMEQLAILQRSTQIDSHFS